MSSPQEISTIVYDKLITKWNPDISKLIDKIIWETRLVINQCSYSKKVENKDE